MKNNPLIQEIFGHIVNIFFFISVLVLISQVLGRGLKLENKQIYSIWLIILNLIFSVFSLLISYFLLKKTKNIWVKIIRSLFFLISCFYFFTTIQKFFYINLFNFPVKDVEIFFSIFIAFLSLSYKIANLAQNRLHPSVIFVLSFLMIIFLGSFLLSLPASINKNIDYSDALFTATSAVTVTGLSTLSVENDLTQFGKIVLLILIQLGGLGVLTFSNLFALIFKSESSFKNRMLIGGMINESNSSNIFKTLVKIFSLTFLIEFFGSILIFFLINKKQISNPVFFSVFHSISAFCNAGFSTFDNQFYEPIFKFNYSLHLIIAWLIITGGLGYKIMISHYFIFKVVFLKSIKFLFKKKYKKFTINHINVNTLIVIRTTVILIILGTLFFFILEYDNTLKEHKSLFGKLLVSFFNAVSPRTAGFMNIKFVDILLPTSILISFLMWIGGSPGSTGGGIKTTTFAIGIVGLFNHIKGKDRITIDWKEIPNSTLNLVNSTIILSIFTIGIGTFFLTIFETKILFKNLFFEVISAYSTVGLSLGITSKISIASKFVLVIIMILGRVGFITFLIGMYRQFFREERQQNRIYPKEKVYI